MGWWSKAWTDRAMMWTYTTLGESTGAVAQADEHYITGTLRSVLPGRVRAGLKRYYGVVHCATTFTHWDQGTAQIHRVVVPSSLRDVDEATVSNAMQLAAPLFGPVPYRGGPLEIEIGLFSIRSVDLAAPLLDTLVDVANVAGATLLPGAAPLAGVLANGMRALTDAQGGPASLELGLARALATPQTADHLILKAGDGEVDIAGWNVGADDLLRDATGRVPLTHPWLVFSLRVSSTRSDWAAIPELLGAHADVRNAVRAGRIEDAQTALEILRRRALSSADLLPRDGQIMYEKVKKLVVDASPGGPVSGHGVDIGPLERIDLYG